MSHQNPDPTGPAQNQPDHGQPQYGQPEYGQPQYGQPAYGQPQYGQPAADGRYGTQPYGVGGQYGTVPEPKKFRTLLTLTLVSAALWVLSSLPGLFAFDDIMATVTGTLDDQPDFSAQDLEAFTTFARTVGIASFVVTLIIGLGLYALVYFNLRGVKNWARVLGIVFAILGVLSIFSAVGYLFSTSLVVNLMGVLTIAYVVVNILWLVVAFNKDVADWFRQGRPATV